MGPGTFKSYKEQVNEFHTDWVTSSDTSVAGMGRFRASQTVAKKTNYHSGFMNADKGLQEKFETQMEGIIKFQDERAGFGIFEGGTGFNNALDTNHKVTQSVLKNVYPSGEIKSFRGQGVGSFARNKMSVPKVGQAGEMTVNSLSSFSTDKVMGEKFKKSSVDGMILEVSTPIDQVYTSYFTNSKFSPESELLITNSKAIRFKRIE